MRFLVARRTSLLIATFACGCAVHRQAAPSPTTTAAVSDAQPSLLANPLAPIPMAQPAAAPQIAAPAPQTNTRAIREAYALSKDVVRVMCAIGPKQFLLLGSGFIHKGIVVTAGHVPGDCKDLNVLAGGKVVPIASRATTPVADLAVLRPGTGVQLGAGLDLLGPGDAAVNVGDTVVWLGFPSGYDVLEAPPMLGVGYLAAIGPFQDGPKAPFVKRAFVSGAFNHGNSGGPVIDLQSNRVMGVVHAKMIPLSTEVDSAMAALKAQTSGFQYTATAPDGHKINMSEAQVASKVLDYVENQIQLVVGVMVLPGDVHEFLNTQNAD